MKRYIVFAFSTEDGAQTPGGAHDIVGDVDDLAETYDLIGRVTSARPWLDTHILDTETCEIIESSPRCAVHSVAAPPADRLAPFRPLDTTEVVEAMRFPPGWKVTHMPPREVPGTTTVTVEEVEAMCASVLGRPASPVTVGRILTGLQRYQEMWGTRRCGETWPGETWPSDEGQSPPD